MTVMPASAKVLHSSVCPHDCPSACSVEVEVLDGNRIGRLRGARDQTYTAGVICAKVARYAERIHHPERLRHPLIRTGPKGAGQFRRASWDEAMSLAAEALLAAERRHGPESVWPYYYAGTMGFVMRDGINRLRHAKRYSGFFDTICTKPAWTGYIAGTGRLAGVDPREMARADCVVIWGTNPVATQVNVMTHAIRARKDRGAKIVAIDIYRTETLQQADLPIILRPGTDAALACAVMHILFRDGFADRDYLDRYTDDPAGLEAHLASRGPAWAAEITGVPEATIEAFARLIGTTKRSFFRLGYGFSRQRNGAINMHAASCIAAVTGAWQLDGGGVFFNNGAIYGWDKTLIEGTDVRDPSVRMLDQSQIGRILTGDAEALRGGPPVTALFIQNTNPVNIAPEQTLVKQGFAREDLVTIVHEQFMTETALMADVVLPATMFLEHDDVYHGGGHQHVMLGPKLIDPPDECRSNHEVVADLAARVGAHHVGFDMTPAAHITHLLAAKGRGSYDELKRERWRDLQPEFATAHFLNGFAWPDGKFRFKPDWRSVPNSNDGLKGPYERFPVFPDHVDLIESADAQHPFRLATSPARSFLNSTFTETPSSMAREQRPNLLLHPEDAASLGMSEGDEAEVGNARGTVYLAVRLFDGVQRGVAIAESLFPNRMHREGRGINTLTGADQIAPYGGAAVHDIRVWIKKA